MTTRLGSLPDFPWDLLAPYAKKARMHPDGIVDLSVGTPVDPTPEIVQRALIEAANAPGYPLTAGTPELREAIAAWFARRFAAVLDPAAVLPVIGTKELVAWLPTVLGAETVGYPALAYPTYDVGARIAGATGYIVDDSAGAVAPARLDLLWINSPSNPTGEVAPEDALKAAVDWAQQQGTVLASDECYADVYYGGTAPASVLSPSVCSGNHTNLLAVHSLSKRSNLAGYRAGFVAGDPALIKRLLEIRKHAGMIVPAPVQAAIVAALADDDHVEAQRARYATRRTLLLGALRKAGFTVNDTGAGLYLWSTRHESCWDTIGWLADRGILAAPGEFYGNAGAHHVRIALTATDERVAAAAARVVSP
jgi:succinyldiaminopimelate transaminase